MPQGQQGNLASIDPGRGEPIRRRRPLSGFHAQALAFTFGALWVLGRRDLPGGILLASLCVPALLPWRGRILCAAAALGALLTAWQGQRLLDQRWPESRGAADVWVRGAVASLPERRDDGDDPGWQFVFEPDASEASKSLPPRIRVGWYRSGAQRPRAGDCWHLQLRLRAPHGSFNPGGYDSEETLLRQHIGATASVRAAESCGSAPGYRLSRWRQQLADTIRGWIPGPGGGLVLALTLGDTSGLDDTDWTAFRSTGTTHLVAISGFNIAIVAGLVFLLARWSWSLVPRLCLRLPAQKTGLIAASLAAIGYATLTGFDPPVARAALTTTLAAIVVVSGASSSAGRLLTWAWLGLIAADPTILLGPGTWLSFGAVAAIFYIAGGRLGHGPAWREGLRLQLMLSLVLAPATIFYFQGSSWLGPLVNLIAVPITAVLTPLLIGLLALAAILPPWGLMPLQLTARATAAGRDGLAWLGDHAPDAWLPISAEPLALLLATFGTILLLAPRGLPLRPLGLVCLLPLLLPPSLAPTSGFDLTALDVGQGLAVVVRTAHHALLFDAGPAAPDGYSAGDSIVAPYLLAVGVHRLDLLVVSHADVDHRGGVPAVRQRLDVADERGALPGQRPCRAGEVWRWDGVEFSFLHPDGAAWGDNNGSCVLKISAGGHAALLPGDIEVAAEDHLLALDSSGKTLRADLLIAPHHGSRTSSGSAFIAAVAPQVVIFPAGWHNRFRHPAPEIVARYRQAGASLWTTGTEGAVTVRFGADFDETPIVAGWRAGHARWWNFQPPGREVLSPVY